MKCVIITWVECRESHRQGSTTHYCLHCGRFVPAVTSLWRPKSPLRIYLTVTTLLEPTRGAERCHKYKSSFSCVMMAYSWERGAMIAGNHPRQDFDLHPNCSNLCKFRESWRNKKCSEPIRGPLFCLRLNPLFPFSKRLSCFSVSFLFQNRDNGDKFGATRASAKLHFNLLHWRYTRAEAP